MRIALYSCNYAPEPIGIPRYNTEMATWLVERRAWSVVVHTGLPHYPWWRVLPGYLDSHGELLGAHAVEVIDGVRVERVAHFVPREDKVTTLARMRLDASWLWATFWRSFSARRRPDAVMVVAPPFLVGVLGCWLAWRWRIPLIYHVQDLQIDAAVDLGMLPGWLGHLLFLSEKLILRRVDLVTTVSLAMARRIRAKAPMRRAVGLFPNWVDPRGLESSASLREFRREWGAGERVVVMYSGSLGRKQGLEVLIDALALVGPECPISAVIAGAGPERMGLEQQVHALGLGNVHFCELVESVHLGDFLRAADFHVIPQRRAAAGSVMPSKLLNIMAVGRPVVVTADPGTDLAQAVRAAGGGLVVEPESPQALARALERLAYNRSEREDCGAAARRYVLARYGIDRVIGAFARAVTAIVRHRRSPRVGRRC